MNLHVEPGTVFYYYIYYIHVLYVATYIIYHIYFYYTVPPEQISLFII